MASGTVLAAIIRALRPTFRSPHDRVVFAVHAHFLSQGYILAGVGTDIDGTAVPSKATREVPIDGWNAQDDWYAFQYVDPSGDKEPLLVKCLKLGGKVVVNSVVLGSGSQAPKKLELEVAAFTSDSDDVVQGYRDLDALASRIASALEESTGKTPGIGRDWLPGRLEDPAPGCRPGSSPSPLDYQPPRVDGVPGGVPGMVGGHHDLEPGLHGGMHVGLDDPMFRGMVRHPELMDRRPGPQFDPIAPPGLPGYRPGDFQRTEPGRVHPDVMPPGGGRGTDWDAMFG